MYFKVYKIFLVVIVLNFNMKIILGICFFFVVIVFLCVWGENDEDCKEVYE